MGIDGKLKVYVMMTTGKSKKLIDVQVILKININGEELMNFKM